MGWQTWTVAEVSQKALDCYCDALAAVDDSSTLQELTAQLERRLRWKGKPVRALHPFDPQDHKLLTVINRGEFAINGLRNRDLQVFLYDKPVTTPKNAAARPLSVASCGCCVHTAYFISSRILIVTA